MTPATGSTAWRNDLIGPPRPPRDDHGPRPHRAGTVVVSRERLRRGRQAEPRMCRPFSGRHGPL
ncbi:hypothetical protein MICRO116_10007 [Micrococcus sp. 116]|nr:hypothetical protein MICRO116_10007 [Micrococcus sp. 116]